MLCAGKQAPNCMTCPEPPRSGAVLLAIEMKHRDVEFTVLQGLSRQLWKWSTSLNGIAIQGQAATKAEAIAEAERAIDRALTPKKLKLIRRDDD